MIALLSVLTLWSVYYRTCILEVCSLTTLLVPSDSDLNNDNFGVTNIVCRSSVTAQQHG